MVEFDGLFSFPSLSEFAAQHYLASKKINFLIVEDDPFMRTIIPKILYKVDKKAKLTWAVSVDEAKELLSKHDGTDAYDLIICDYLLSGKKHGIDLWKHCLTQQSLHIPFMLISGLSQKALRKHSGLNDFVKIHYLGKPFEPKQFQHLVEELL